MQQQLEFVRVGAVAVCLLSEACCPGFVVLVGVHNSALLCNVVAVVAV